MNVSFGTSSPGQSWTKGRETIVVVVVLFLLHYCYYYVAYYKLLFKNCRRASLCDLRKYIFTNRDDDIESVFVTVDQIQ